VKPFVETPHILNDPEHWRSRAEQARTLAEQMDDPEAARLMVGIADGYDELAKRAEGRLAKRR
jgi:hypothetical protein